MQRLKITKACTVLQLGKEENSDTPMLEQALPYFKSVPYLILNAEGLNFTSLQIGELAKLGSNFGKIWKDAPHALAIVNLTKESREIFSITRLDGVFDVYDSLSSAIDAFH